METVNKNGRTVAIISAQDSQIIDGQSALDAVMSASYSADTQLIAIEKTALADDFFDLKTGIAGDILQKFINYHITAAVFGDFSSYQSEALKALMRESNRGKDFFFCETKEEALEKLLSLS